MITESLWAVLGWVLGVGLNAIVHELPRSERLASWPQCPDCGARLRLAQLTILPLPGGRTCPGCGRGGGRVWHSLDWITAVLFGLLAWRLGFSPVLVVYSVYTLFLLTVLAIDLQHRWVYSVVCYPGILLGLVLTPAIGAGLWAGALGALIGGGVFLALYWVGRLVYRGQEAMGSGDITIATMIGAMVGAHQVLVALFLGGLLVAAASLLLLLSRRARARDYVPYGAGLCAGALAALILEGAP